MQTALGIIEAVREAGAQIFVHEASSSIVLVGEVPRGLKDDVERRRDDIVAIFREHEPTLSVIGEAAIDDLLRARRRKQRAAHVRA